MEGVSILREESLVVVHFLVSGRWKDFGGRGRVQACMHTLYNVLENAYGQRERDRGERSSLMKYQYLIYCISIHTSSPMFK